MTSDHLMGDWKLDRRISVGTDYEVCQRWALALNQAGFDGVYYEARHHREGRSVALFGDPGVRRDKIAMVADEPISRDLREEAMAIFHLPIVPPGLLPPLPPMY
jgi:hypothetical protein